MAAVVRPRGELVDEQPTVADEQLDGEHADEAEVVGDAQRQTGRLGRDVGADPGRYHGEVEDAADVVVLGDRVHGRAAVGGAGDEDAELGVERHPLLDDARARPSSSRAAASSAGEPTSRWPLPS